MSICFVFLLAAGLNTGAAHGATWEFGSSGSGQNPFTPRGYLVDTEKGQHWLSSPFDNSSQVVRYSGKTNGVDYLEAKKSDGSDYTFYAMTDRNPWTDKNGWIGKGRLYLFACKNGSRISDFTRYVKTPAVRADKVDPSGNGTCWAFKIEGFQLDPGCRYEFGFLKGMQANNGITLVLDENKDNPDIAYGYIRQSDEDQNLSSEERKIYNEQKNEEYQFISSWRKAEKDEHGQQYRVNRVPMRFGFQTYADLSKWEKSADKAQTFLNSVSSQDLKKGKYKRENIKQLRLLLESLNKKAEKEIRMLLQPAADKKIKSMIKDLEAMVELAKSDKPQPADIRKLTAKLKQARDLYARASANTGSEKGQYGRIEVENLKEEIDRAAEMDQYTPQNEINDEVEALENAMTEVKASMVQKEQMIFYDKITGIYVIAPVDSLPQEAKLFVQQMDRETRDWKSMENNLSKEETEAVYYKIQFYQGDRKIQPTDSVEVEIPVSDDISQKNSNVYSVGEKGKLTKVKSVSANGTRFFETKHLEAFVLAGSTATEEEKAEKRGERMKALMARKNDQDADDKRNQLEKDKKKKEEFKDPLNKMLKRNANTATFSNDIRKETEPVYLIFVAAALAAAAVVLGVRGLWEKRRKRLS